LMKNELGAKKQSESEKRASRDRGMSRSESKGSGKQTIRESKNRESSMRENSGRGAKESGRQSKKKES